MFFVLFIDKPLCKCTFESLLKSLLKKHMNKSFCLSFCLFCFSLLVFFFFTRQVLTEPLSAANLVVSQLRGCVLRGQLFFWLIS